MIRSTKITIFRIRKPQEKSINDELQWFFDSLGILGNRDKNKSCFRTVIVLLKNLRQGDGLTSDEIAERVQLSRGTVVHHLHSLMNAGVVVSNRSRYMLRVENLKKLIDEIEDDLYKTMAELKQVAEEIDKRLEL
ncbi:MAG: ArsR family transcriptional regulator [Candidatus Woesearchaeota archaeon]|jgi:predicted transcriptional regulator|nr:ArsR family transcriptional regulator [Candidatus Woesearchaeota archaeon]